MNIIYQKFFYGLRWNALESILYQAILLSHQLLLFRVIPSDVYGLIGIIFSLLYLIISVSDLGFDISLPAFFLDCTKSKKSFRHLLLPQLIPELLLLMSSGIIMHITRQFIPFSIPATTLFILALLLLTESIKKNLRTFLQIAFLNKITSLIEIIGVVGYVGTIWIGFICGYSITLNAIFFPMLTTSIITNLFLGHHLYVFYKNLPEDHAGILPTHSRIIRNRFFNFGTQLHHLLFSSNFLIPLLSLQGGLAQAGILKLISNITYSSTNLIRKTFSLTSDALFSHTKYMDMETKRELFNSTTNILYQFLYGMIIFFIVNYKKILCLHGLPENNSFWIAALLFLILQFSEYFFMTYEKFFIAQEKAHYLCLFNLAVGIFIYGIIHAVTCSLTTLLAILLIIRLTSLAFMSCISFYTWQLSFPRSIHAKTLFYSFSIAFIFFMLVR